jgi:hypothetical protein
MRQLGLSIYPGNASLEDFKRYIDKASKLGYKRIFTCMISASEGDDPFKPFKELVGFAAERDMQVIADVDPGVFKALNLDYQNLKYFSQMGLYGIRLDLGFTGIEESIMTYNPYDLKIEINMSNGTKYLDNILSHRPNRDNLIGCHNFYPHRYTGLSRAHFLECSEQFKSYNIGTSAFVNAQSATFGPWPVNEGLCTLEEHRGQGIVTQAKDLFYTDLIDNVIIANGIASDEELEALASVSKSMKTLKVDILPTASALERKIVLEELHFNRGDISDYLIRSTQSRVKYKGESFPVQYTPDLVVGDIIIESDLYARYAGELQVAKGKMTNSGKSNVVARIQPQELHLLDHIKPWDKFAFEE